MNSCRTNTVWPIVATVLVSSLATLLHAQEVIIYSHGFEKNDGSFTVLETGNSAGWAWGAPSASSVGPKAAHSGSQCWGTVLSGPIPRICDGSIVSPPIALPILTTNEILRVRFWAYIDLDGMRDRGEFFVSTNRTSWQSLIQFYNTMEQQATLPPSWKLYEFSLDPSYSGMSLYLRFRGVVFSASPSFYCGGTGNLSGVYIDDIAVSKHLKSGADKLFFMEAWEDPSSSASCPWIAPWNGTEFLADNDIYSVARGFSNEYTDSYLLRNPLVPLNGAYLLELQEREQETSYTDFTGLMTIDHAPDVAVAPNADGRLSAYRPESLLSPASATSSAGENVLPLVSKDDGNEFPAFSGDWVVVSFGAADVSQGAVLVLKVKGFIPGDSSEMPFTGPPAVVVETRNERGAWVERGRLLPHFEASVNAFDMKPFLTPGASPEIRLRSISHSIKYHAIDFVGLHTGRAPDFTTRTLLPEAAWFGSQSVLPLLQHIDGDHFRMSSGEKVTLSFPVPVLPPGVVRDFVFLSRGYYIPGSGSYLVYTWDGAAWVQRDSFTYPGSDATKVYDLSLFLPDPNGEYRVRVWQDYQYEPAGIDYVKMTVRDMDAALNFAWDHRSNLNISNVVRFSDNVRTAWTTCPRNRLTEYAFTSVFTNIPPTVAPVTAVAGPETNGFTIQWNYTDTEASPQAQAEVQVWSGSGATGDNLWNPLPLIGTNQQMVYGGPALTTGTYYVRVRANDGTDWGPWSEGAWTPGGSECGLEIVSASALTVNPQTGLLEQRVVVGNSCESLSATPFRLVLDSLPEGVEVYSTSGTNALGATVVQYDGSITANGPVTLTIEYYSRTRTPFTPGITLESAEAGAAPTAVGQLLAVTAARMLPGGNFLVEFNSVSNRTYVIQYCSALTNWICATPPIRAVANRTLWIDAGPPKTQSPPGSGERYYRVVELPQ